MTYEAFSDTEASYMAWIVMVPPSARHPQVRFQVCYQEGKRHRSAGIFVTERRALAEKRALERRQGEQAPAPADLSPERAQTLFGEYVTTRWWPAWKDQHPSSEYGTRKKVEKRILPTFGDIPLGELDPSTIGKWKAAMVAEGLTARTVNTYLSLLAQWPVQLRIPALAKRHPLGAPIWRRWQTLFEGTDDLVLGGVEQAVGADQVEPSKALAQRYQEREY
jgi:hypothetical protein